VTEWARPRGRNHVALGEDSPRILVVDDRPENLVAMVEVLRELGHPIITASSGNEALRILMQQEFALILLDVNMPGINGFELSKLIREREQSAQTPIIFVTAISTEDAAVAQGYSLGAVDYVFSPVVPEILRAKVRLKVALFVELHARTKQLGQRTKELERANHELEQFAYVASHDLRAPLRAIDSLSAWLEEDLGDVLKGEQREQMRLLRGRVHRMDRLLTDLLDYAREGKADHGGEKVDVGQLISEVIDLSNLPKGFVVETKGQVPPFTTRKVLLQRIFMNLISNAIKHHDKEVGRIEVTVRDGGAAFEFLVADDGPGIPAQFQAKAFQMFQTLKARDVTEGSGMGLALVKKIVETAGGTIALDSNGRGATFRFTWPKVQSGATECVLRSGVDDLNEGE
jgi:signal transduction histidine kinase